MLHIILAILKIIGILILILLGVLLFLVIAVLAAPVTYRISGGWDRQLRLQGKIHWLYHIVGISIGMNDGEPEIGISLFGRGNGSEDASKKKKNSKKRKRLKRKRRQKERSGEAVQRPLAETAEWDGEPEPEFMGETPEDAGESGLQGRTESEPDWDSLLDEELESAQPVEWSEEPEKKRRHTSGKKAFETEDAESETEEGMEPEENSIVQLIRQVLVFLKQPPVKKLTGKLWRSIRKLFRHVRPSDLQLQAIVGTGDPASTGKIMELAAVLYAFYGDRIQIVSDFDEKVLEAEFTVRGWLVPGYLLIKLLFMALRVFFSKECRSFYREIRQGISG